MKTLFKISLIAILFIGVKTEAFTCTAQAGGGNWNSSATWSGCNSTIPQTGDSVVFDGSSGNVAVNVSTTQLASFVMTGYTGTLSGSGTITIRGVTASTQDVIFDGTVTWTGTLTISPVSTTADINLTTNGTLLNSINMTSGSNADVFLQDNLSFSAIKTNVLTITPNRMLDTNSFTVSGNSNINRLLINSSSIGTQADIIRDSGAFANVDFRDIDLEASYDCSAITGGCGDALGNSADFTFTSPQTNYWIGGTGDWSDINEWANSSGGSAGSGRVPLPQDFCVFDNNSFDGAIQTSSTDMPRACADIDWSDYSEDDDPRWSTPIGFSTFGSVTLTSSMTVANSASNFIFEGRGDYTFTSAGTSWAAVRVRIRMVGGKLTLQDSFSMNSGGLVLENGELDTNGMNVTVLAFDSSGSATRTLTLHDTVWTSTATDGAGGPWNMSSSLTLTPHTSTIIISNTSATSKTFVGAGKTYYNLTITGDDVTITGNNTFNTLTLDNGSEAEGLIVGTGSTQTIDSIVNGSSCQSGAICLLNGVAGGGTETLSDSVGDNCVDWTTITNITASGGAGFYAPYASADGGGTSGWTFGACPEDEVDPDTGTHATSSEKVRGGTKVRGGVKFR